MSGTPRLTEAQWRRLGEIANYQPTTKWPRAAFWKGSPTDRSLIKRGFIERNDVERPLGGGGALGGITATWNCCQLTPAGRAAWERRNER